MNGLEGKNTELFVTGDLKQVDENSSEFSAWKSNNSTICSWLFNSIDIFIQPSVAGHKFAFEMWNDLKECYAVMNRP